MSNNIFNESLQALIFILYKTVALCYVVSALYADNDDKSSASSCCVVGG